MQVVTERGEIVRWTAYGSRGWGTGAMRSEDAREVAIVGLVPGARPGDRIEIEGVYETHERWGQQLVIARAELSPPTSVDGACAWLTATLPYVGTTRARAMLAHFGSAEATWQVLDSEPERLCELDGITPTRADELHQAYRKVRMSRAEQVTMASWGMTPNQIAKCAAAGVSSQDIREDPYVLVRNVPGFGWLRADVVARRTGLPLDAPTRIDAGIQHAIDTHHTEGHAWMRAGLFQVACEALLNCDRSVVLAGLMRALDKGLLVKRGSYVYSRRSDSLEQTIVEAINDRLG